jgi:hypothetical protein
MIKLFITGQKLVVETPLIVADTIDYLEASAVFRTKDWDGVTKWLHISNGTDDYNLLFDNDIITKEKHLNLTTGEWTLFVHGTIGNTRITTNEVTITVESTGMLDGQPLPDIPISETEQILQIAQSSVNIANSVREDADNGEFNGKTPYVGENGNWFVGDIDTGTKAQGQQGDDGFSPSASVTQLNNKVLFSVTDKKGTTEAMLETPKEEWITIADTTLTEEVARVDITIDNDGKAFECKKLYVEVYTPQAATTSAGIIGHGATYITWTPNIVHTNAQGYITKCFMRIEGGMLTGSGFSAYASDYAQMGMGNLFQTGFGGVMLDSLTKVRVLVSSGVFPVGTTIKVLGVEA